MDDESAAVLFGILIVVVVLCIYLIPTIVAICRKSYYSTPAIILNIFLGWSFFGWVVALVLALSNEPAEREAQPQQIIVKQFVGVNGRNL